MFFGILQYIKSNFQRVVNELQLTTVFKVYRSGVEWSGTELPRKTLVYYSLNTYKL